MDIENYSSHAVCSMNNGRDSNGRWMQGVSGNPAGRPVGARDKRQRSRNCGEQPRAIDNLGVYAFGGLGVPRTAIMRTQMDYTLEAFKVMGQIGRHRNAPISMHLRAVRLLEKSLACDG